jgi:ABC-type tungstate transport system substrate-binding protein
LANAMLGLPPVVVGLGIYLLLTRSGPFGRASCAKREKLLHELQSILHDRS